MSQHGLYDIRKSFLQDDFQVIYKKIDVQVSRTGPRDIRFTLQKTCDFVNRIDLVVEHPSSTVNSILKKIVVECDSQRFDSIGGEDMDVETQIRTSCILMNKGRHQRQIMHRNGKTYIPLVMAPFYDHNMAFVSATVHDYSVVVTLADTMSDVALENFELYGNTYHLDNAGTKKLHDYNDFFTLQNQFCIETMRVGENCFKLDFVSSGYLIYFWGFDKSKVTNVRLKIEGHTYFDGSLDSLEYFKMCQGYGSAEPCMIFFSQNDLDEPSGSTVDFSTAGIAHLLITTTQTAESRVYIVGISMQKMLSHSGMMGLAYGS